MTVKEVHELVGLLAAYYDADSARRGGTGPMAARRQAQIIALCEVQRVLENRKDTLLWLRDRGDLIPLSPSDLEEIAHGRLLADTAETEQQRVERTLSEFFLGWLSEHGRSGTVVP